MTVRLALFDCDGTMVDSQGAICAAMEAAFATHRLPPPDRHAVRRVVGLSLAEAVRQLLPDEGKAKIELVVEAYKDGFAERRAGGLSDEPLYPGLVELLGALDAAGWLLGVATGKSDRGLRHSLRMHGLSDRFVTLQTADRHPSKPHPSMIEAACDEAGATSANTVMIGDTTFDMAMAARAGAGAFGVDWGYHEPAELTAAGAEIVARSMDELERALLGRTRP